MKTPKATILLVIHLAGISGFAQETLTLIGPAIRNGSFEDRVAPPWGGYSKDFGVTHGPAFASHGEWFATVTEIAVSSIARPSIWQRVAGDRSDGLTFLLTFDARNGTAGFDGIRVFFVGQNGDGTFVSPTNVFFASPPLPALAWQTYQARFELSDAWEGGGSISLGLQFEKTGAIVGMTYVGYLDNVILQQIPEPSACALLGLGGGGLLAARRLWRCHEGVSR
jgi:hypothetical protein